jgi:uncharacterized membrane-anchored protein
MLKMIRGVAMAMLVMAAGLANAQAVEEDPLAAFIASLQFQQGEVAVPEANARLRLTEGFRYLGKADARRVLEEFWGNPPDDSVLGMLVPTADGLDSDHSWAVILTWSDDGYVSDQDAAEIDYAELLETMQAEARDANPMRQEAGYPAVDLIGWAQPPRYDATAKRLHWAKHLQFEGSEGGTLNYDIRVLGREGYLSMSAIAGMADLDRVNDGMNEVLAMAEFEEGHRYADFNADTDRTAAYGLAALVGGGLAAKTGLLAKLGLFLAKFWKLLLIAGVGVVALVRKVRGTPKDEGGTAA